MKKLLSILSSIGLVATASTSVVSCTRKQSLPTYNDVDDISGNFLSENQALCEGDKLPDAGGEVTNSTVKEHILGTISTMFKNSDDMVNKLKSDNNIKIDVTKPEVIDSKGTKTYGVYIVRTNKDGQIVNSSDEVKMISTSKEYLDASKPAEETVPIDAKYQKSNAVAIITNLFKDMATVDNSKMDDYVDIKSESSELMSMDSQFFLVASQQLGKEYVPGFDSNGVRYESIDQQVRMSYSKDTISEQRKNGLETFRKKMISFNEGILQDLRDDLPNYKGKNIEISEVQRILNKNVHIINDGKKYVKFAINPSKETI